MKEKIKEILLERKFPYWLFFLMVVISVCPIIGIIFTDSINLITTFIGFQNYISEEVLFWTFSTIVQSFVALVALLGMVTIYRIQILKRGIELVAESMRKHLINYKKDNFVMNSSGQDGNHGWIVESSEVYGYPTMKIIKEVKGQADAHPEDGVLQRANLEFFNFETNTQEVKIAAKLFFCFTISLIIFSLVLLPTSLVLQYNIWGLLSLWLIIFWSCASFILGLNLLISLL